MSKQPPQRNAEYDAVDQIRRQRKRDCGKNDLYLFEFDVYVVVRVP